MAKLRPVKTAGRSPAPRPSAAHRHIQTGKADRQHQWRHPALRPQATFRRQLVCSADSALYVTTSEDPLDFGMPEAVVQAARAPAGQRKPEQAAAIIDYYRSHDTEFWKRKQAVAKASEPLPEDPKLTELKQALANAEEPIQLDP